MYTAPLLANGQPSECMLPDSAQLGHIEFHTEIIATIIIIDDQPEH